MNAYMRIINRNVEFSSYNPFEDIAFIITIFKLSDLNSNYTCRTKIPSYLLEKNVCL